MKKIIFEREEIHRIKFFPLSNIIHTTVLFIPKLIHDKIIHFERLICDISIVKIKIQFYINWLIFKIEKQFKD